MIIVIIVTETQIVTQTMVLTVTVAVAPSRHGIVCGLRLRLKLAAVDEGAAWADGNTFKLGPVRDCQCQRQVKVTCPGRGLKFKFVPVVPARVTGGIGAPAQAGQALAQSAARSLAA